MAFLSKIFGDANKRTIEKLQPVVDQINNLESQFESFSREQLRAKTQELRELVVGGEELDVVLPEAFAMVREAAKRTQKKRHFDVQLMGGIILHQGKIAEMHTGEGKTLVATLPAYLNALTGKGVHIVTVNDYLSRRDAVWMGEIYNYLGLTVGVLNHETSFLYDESIKKEEEKDEVRDDLGSFKVVHEFLRPVTRREAYQADITYGTNNEYGFDYLRDNMAYDLSQTAQIRGTTRTSTRNYADSESNSVTVGVASANVSGGASHNFAIVDEVDSILIDESRTPLIISAPDNDSGKLYTTFAKIVPKLTETDDYTVDEKLKAISITETGIEKVEKILGIDNIYNEGGTRYVHHLEQALKAEILFKLDRDYVVREGEVIIVDEFTGRLMPGRRWSEGLHQAVEAKEGVMVQKESRTLATITFQNYFRLYSKLSGMTGTAQTSAEEFHKVYKLDVVTIPTNKPMQRENLSDRIYKNEVGKFRAIAQEIKARHETGQPILVGTVSITKNEILSEHLKREGVPHKVLNAKNHEQEGEIIAQAGRFGGVTVATNMAGRGVDIILGGNPPETTEAQKVKELGGLHVIGTERHEARRIDNQLRGRAGRQGDPGSSQFFVSTEDEVVRIFGGDRLKNVMERLGVSEDENIENGLISRAIESAQSKIEGHNFDIRHYVLEYDDVMSNHRKAIYQLRNEALVMGSVKDKILGYLNSVVDSMIGLHMANTGGSGFKMGIESMDMGELIENLNNMIPGVIELKDKINEAVEQNNYEAFSKLIFDYVSSFYEKREQELGAETMRSLERMLLLRVIDELWVDHLDAMEYLRDSVRLRAYGQRDPLVEYKIEGQKMFIQLQDALASQVANLIFKVSFVQHHDHKHMETGRKEITAPTNLQMGDKMEEESSRRNAQPIRNEQNIGRNDPCPCGAVNPETGKVYKYKKCGMINALYHKG